MHKGTIILLNGVSSSGKSTLAKELVKRLPDYFHLSVDDFAEMVGRMEEPPDRLIPVATESFFHRTVAMFSDSGVNLVVDQILHDALTRNDCFEVLRDYPVLLVGVHCPVEELERREKARGDRHIGQAKRQMEFVHGREVYDVTVDTFAETIEQCADKIVTALRAGHYPEGWSQSIGESENAPRNSAI